MSDKKAWIVSVDMGYGHERASYPLREIAFERVITANSDKIISNSERRIWDLMQYLYELVSQIREVPIIGEIIFKIYDRFQSISPLFPFRDLSKPNFDVWYFKRLILKKGLCQSLIDYVKKADIPFVTTHFVPALAAHYLGLKKIYCIVTDVDINRVWIPDHPQKSQIKYLVPARRTAHRLKEYGIPESNIFLTGFPLPEENIGQSSEIVKKDLGIRLPNLDPKGIYLKKSSSFIKKELGDYWQEKSSRPLSVTYAVGGAGAEKDIGVKIAISLKEKIKKGELVLNLIAGTHLNVKSYFEKSLKKVNLDSEIGENIKIIYGLNKPDYFKNFNEIIRITDILWTKPSELSFYAGLGLPIIIAPPIGAHENFNKEWLEHAGAGFVQDKPEYVNDWLFYWLEDGHFAEAAWDAFLKAPRNGTEKIKRIVLE